MSESLGILRLEGLVYFVHDASRSHQFYVERLDFSYIGNSSLDYEQSTGMTSKVYRAGNCQVTIALTTKKATKVWRTDFSPVIQMVLENWFFKSQISTPHFVY